jgi:SAM-dependent methyltransferase
MSDWSDDERFWEAMEPALCASSRLGLADADVAAILAAVERRPKDRVLDLGCGPGAHAIAFARLGYRVTGVDTSVRLLDRARSAARAANVEVEWVQEDIRSFQRPSGYDLICSLYASFGYFEDAENRRVLRNVWTSLAPGGVLVLDVIGREALARHWEERRWQEVDGVLYLERRSTANDWSSLVSDWIVVRHGVRSDFRARQRLYSSTELRELLLSLGFGSVALAADLSGETPYDESARRLVALARKESDSPSPVEERGTPSIID